MVVTLKSLDRLLYSLDETCVERRQLGEGVDGEATAGVAARAGWAWRAWHAAAGTMPAVLLHSPCMHNIPAAHASQRGPQHPHEASHTP